MLLHLFMVSHRTNRSKRRRQILLDSMKVSITSSDDDAKHDHKCVGGDESATDLKRPLIVRHY